MNMFRMFSPYPPKPTPQKYCTYRSIETQAAYDALNAQSDEKLTNACALCDKDGERIVVQDLGVIRVITNDFPYAVFCGLPVREHLVVVPARHVSQLGMLDSHESKLYWDICAEYNDRGYSVVTQAVTKSMRSIPDHTHTHLILCGD